MDWYPLDRRKRFSRRPSDTIDKFSCDYDFKGFERVTGSSRQGYVANAIYRVLRAARKTSFDVKFDYRFFRIPCPSRFRLLPIQFSHSLYRLHFYRASVCPQNLFALYAFICNNMFVERNVCEVEILQISRTWGNSFYIIKDKFEGRCKMEDKNGSPFILI